MHILEFRGGARSETTGRHAVLVGGTLRVGPDPTRMDPLGRFHGHSVSSYGAVIPMEPGDMYWRSNMMLEFQSNRRPSLGRSFGCR